MKYRYKILIQVAVLFLPFWLMIEGIIGLINKELFHPDAFVLLGLLTTGIISTINILNFINRLRNSGWRNLDIYYKIFFCFHLILFIPSFMVWLHIFGIVNVYKFFW
ncbi:hypothetical protein M2S00_02525 [Apilactobacillus sp. TMW 2.2459]|uniref:hypothetical protein n=1 Tax=Apilactobacillus xinyiensis TaxID=2841032 RepID=UPI00200E6AEF|nr:hypothetical protein [Apilactobacillus xinyiensis]MCL0311975.1 hypothetical protein [Apilactobacillus xinyiensis]